MERRLRAIRAASWAGLVAAAALCVHAEAIRPGPPTGVRAYLDITYRHVGPRRARLDVYAPRGEATPSGRPAVLAIHGGGWRGGSKNSFGREVARLAERGFVVVSVEYVLSEPGRPSWPENLDDVREAVRWVRRHAGDYGIDPGRIAALGASAGGHLAALLGTDAAGDDDPEAKVQAVVDLYGPSDLARLYAIPKAAESLQLYLGRGPSEIPDRYLDASPMAHASGRSAPTLLIHGAADPLVPLAQSLEMADRLRASGVPAEVIVVPGVGHAFGLEVRGRDLVPEIVRFLDGAWSHRG